MNLGTASNASLPLLPPCCVRSCVWLCVCSRYFVENGSKLVDKAYAQAGGIATECLFSMRTITSLGVEHTFEGRYSSSLARVRRAFITNTTVLGFSGGLALSAYLVMMVLIRASNLHVTACLP